MTRSAFKTFRLTASLGLLAFACKGEAVDPSVATTITANSSTTLTGAAGSQVSPAPSVLVKDQNGAPMAGATVNLLVLSGGGTVSGATVTTDASGVATAAWTLGTTVGNNALNMWAGTVTAITFTATATAGAAASLTKSAGDNQAGTAGLAVPVAPSVIVKDANGNVKADVVVTFAVATGGGSVTGGTATSNALGIATVGSWILGATGTNTLTASAPGVPTVTFTATATAGAAASLTKSAGDNQAGTAGLAVPVAPSVIVKDANGNVKADVVVTFAVATGGGSVTGGTATSNALGIATVGSWILGATGTNTLSASAPGVPTVTFTANATPNLCADATTHILGGTSNGALATTDCLLDGFYYDFFIATLAEANAYVFRQSAAFDAYLLLITPDGNLLAENDDESSATTNPAIKVLLPPGTYVLAASSLDEGTTGNYAVTSGTTSTDVRGCEDVFLVKNVSTNQNVEATDCSIDTAPNTIYADGYFIFLPAGQSVTVSMSSSAVDSYLELRRVDESGTIVASNDNKDTSGTKDATVVYTATTTSYYAIVARTAVIGQTGAYTLQIQ